MVIFAQTLRAFLSPVSVGAVPCAVFAIAAFTLLIPVGAGDSASEIAWQRRAPIIALSLWLPAILIAMGLRRAWPFFGPGDEGLALVRTHAPNPVLLRLRSCGAILLATILLQLLAGLALAAVLASSETPGLRAHHAVAPDGDRFLARAGNRVSFQLPSTTSGARLRLEPISGYGTASLKMPTDYELTGPGDVLFPFRLRESGDHALLEIGRHEAGAWSVVRLDGGGTASDFVRGRIALEDARRGALGAGLAVSLALLPWALALTVFALFLSRFVEPAIHAIAVLTAALLSHAVSAGEGTGDLLARGAIPTALPSFEGSWQGLQWTAFLLMLAFAICVPHVRPRREAHA